MPVLTGSGIAADPQHHELVIDMVKRMWRKMERIGDESLFNTHDGTLRPARTDVRPGIDYSHASNEARRISWSFLMMMWRLA